MKNKKLYPFTRNHYFYGKLLTVRDFEEEQRYFNDKRRLNNLLLHGAGVAAGLDIIKIDDKTISVEAGFAIDYQGREIVVPESVICRLDILDGFDRLIQTDEVYLCIEYQEDAKEEVHSIAGSMAGGEMDSNFNRIQEGYHLFLTELPPQKERVSLDSLARVTKVLFKEAGVTIRQEIPCYAVPGQVILIQVTIEKKDVTQPVHVNYTITSAAFETPIQIQFQEEEVKAYQSVELTCQVLIRKELERGAVAVSQTKGTVLIGSTVFSVSEDMFSSLQIVFHSPEEHIIQKYRRMHLEELVGERTQEQIYLARLQLIRKDEIYYIEQVEALPLKQYILNNTLLALLLKTKTPQCYFETKEEGREKEEEAQSQLSAATEQPQNIDLWANQEADQNRFACGETYIETDLRSSKKTYYSDELTHGLGIGDVFLWAAVKTEPKLEPPLLIFGDPSIFSKGSLETGLPQYQIAIRENPARGTFRIGIRFLEDIKAAHVLVKWWAWKPEQKEALESNNFSKVTVSIEPTTVQIKPKEKIKFQATVEGAESQECNWSVTDFGGGFVDREGWYKAPAKEGVYEIVVESARYPDKKASAFAVVKKG